MYIKTISLPFRIFQTFCLSPLKLDDKTYLPKECSSMTRYSLFLVIFSCISFICSLFSTSVYTHWSFSKMLWYFTVLSMAFVRIISIIILTESLVKRKKQIIFLENIHKIDSILRRKLGVHLPYDLNHRRSCLVTISWLMTFCIYVTINLLCADDITLVYFWLMYAIPLFIASMRYLQMILYVNAIKFRFQTINKLIQNIHETTSTDVNVSIMTLEYKKILNSFSKQTFKFKKMLVIKRLIYVRQIYDLLYENIELVNYLFQWSLPFNVAHDFLYILTDWYWCFLWILHPSLEWIISTLPALVGALFHTLHIVLVTNECYYTTSEANTMAGLIHKIDFAATDERLYDLVKIRGCTKIP